MEINELDYRLKLFQACFFGVERTKRLVEENKDDSSLYAKYKLKQKELMNQYEFVVNSLRLYVRRKGQGLKLTAFDGTVHTATLFQTSINRTGVMYGQTEWFYLEDIDTIEEL